MKNTHDIVKIVKMNTNLYEFAIVPSFKSFNGTYLIFKMDMRSASLFLALNRARCL